MTEIDGGQRGPLLFQMNNGSRAGSAARVVHRDPNAGQNQQAIAFASVSAEGDVLLKQGDYERAIQSYNRALDLKADERLILISRSKCYMLLGKYQQALRDANRALSQDKTFFRAILQKAEVHFSSGEFEIALIYYHRGAKVRSDQEDFRLGIQKATKAIEDAIDGVEIEPFLTDNPGNEEADETKDALGVNALSQSPILPVASVNSSLVHPSNNLGGGLASSRAKDAKSVQPSERGTINTSRTSQSMAAKKLLGRLQNDKDYLQQLLADPSMSKKDSRLSAIAEGGLEYLDKREDFWRQQNGEIGSFTYPQPARHTREMATDKTTAGKRKSKKKAPNIIAESDPSPGAGSTPMITETTAPTLPPIHKAQPNNAGGTSHSGLHPHTKPANQSLSLSLSTTEPHQHQHQHQHQQAMSDTESGSPMRSTRNAAIRGSRTQLARSAALTPYFIEQSHDCMLTMQHISKAIHNHDHETSLRFSTDFLVRLQRIEIPDKPRLVVSLHHFMGVGYAGLGKYAYAAAHHRKELETALEYEFGDFAMRALGSLGLSFLRLGEYAQALEVFNLRIKHGPAAEIPETYLSIGQCHLESGDHAQGLKYAGMCVQLLDAKAEKDEKDEKEEKEATLRLRFDAGALAGACFTGMSRNRDALLKYEQMAQLARRMQDTQAEADALSLMASCYTKLGDADKSTSLQQMAVSLRSARDRKPRTRSHSVSRKKLTVQAPSVSPSLRESERDE